MGFSATMYLVNDDGITDEESVTLWLLIFSFGVVQTRKADAHLKCHA